MFHSKRNTRWLAVILLIALHATADAGRSRFDPLRKAVVKIHVTIQREDYRTPWQSGRPAQATGSGFITKGRRILTNAHVVSDARFIEVQKDGHPGRYQARVVFPAHDCDLAALEVDDPAFFEDTRPLEFASDMPNLNDEVTVLGYPTGGERISVTRGVVSRIDYSGYSHSGVDQHLVLQVDAAINPGNSGGPILYNRRVVGLAFQGLAWADNIGYAIPLPVIRHFLDDIEDGTYHGYPELGAFFLPTRNAALRTDLGLPEDEDGVVLYTIDPFGSALGHLNVADVLLTADGYNIASDGTIGLNGDSVLFAELLERKQWGETVRFRVWRDHEIHTIDVPLTNPADPFVFRNQYDTRPEYFTFGGLLFTPLGRDMLRTLERQASDPNVLRLFYYTRYAKVDELYGDRDQFVVLTRRMPHPVNTYAARFENGIVVTLNDQPIRNLVDLAKAASAPRDGYHVFRFEDSDEALVLDAADVEAATPQIHATYGITSPAWLGTRTGVSP